jgi:Zn-finger nucleic acid-binding protein
VLALAGWSLLAWSQGPFVLAVTLFSPISSSLIFAAIALCLWQVRCLSRHAASSRAALIARGVCPSCDYPLAPLTPNVQATRCPECGGVWNLSRASEPPQIVRVPSCPSLQPASLAPSIAPRQTNDPHARSDLRSSPHAQSST